MTDQTVLDPVAEFDRQYWEGLREYRMVQAVQQAREQYAKTHPVIDEMESDTFALQAANMAAFQVEQERLAEEARKRAEAEASWHKTLEQFLGTNDLNSLRR